MARPKHVHGVEGQLYVREALVHPLQGGGELEESDDEQGEDYEDSDDDGPTAKNPWGRDGDALRGGADAFQKRPSKKRFAKTG